MKETYHHIQPLLPQPGDTQSSSRGETHQNPTRELGRDIAGYPPTVAIANKHGEPSHLSQSHRN